MMGGDSLKKEKVARISGRLALFFLAVFIANIAIGKYMHINKMSIVAPINGVAEFLLFGLIIILFTICSLIKEQARDQSK